MKAPLNLSSAVEKTIVIIAFLPVITMVYPKITAAAHTAQNQGEKALVFQVNSKQKSNLNFNSQTSLSYQELSDYHSSQEAKKNQVLVDEVRKYLEAKGSPLAPYSEEIVKQPQWQRALAISYVESNFGKQCADNNCSGIGVSPKHPSWRRYPTKLDWFKDMSRLLEKPIYKERYTNCKAMMGVYVVPGSPRWLNGCNKVSNELLAITEKAQNSQLEIAVIK